MKFVIFGLTLSSSWGNGHATPYRAIVRALHQLGADVTFFERDVPYYSTHRDFATCDYCDLVLYGEWSEVRQKALHLARASDVVITASYCPDGARVNNDVLEMDGPLRVFYDLDTPITLSRLQDGPLEYLRREQIPEFDLYLSFTGGDLIRRLERDYKAQIARPLYGCVDPDLYRRVPLEPTFKCALSFLGTYAPDRQQKVQELFLEPADRRKDLEFLLAGSLYPDERFWPENVRRLWHVSPDQHPALYSSSLATLNVTRQQMADSGFCPSGRFFEAAACGTPILTDWWEGLDDFFAPGREVHVVRTPDDVIGYIGLPEAAMRETGERARVRTLEEHTGTRRAQKLLAYCEEAYRYKRPAEKAA